MKGEYPSRGEGTPQGGVISPLLANIALDGFENLGSNQWTRKRSRPDVRGIRYADDAVFICKPGADIRQLQSDIDEWLAQKGLKINEAKTPAQARRSAGVRKATEGFDFLGWHFRVNSRGRFKSVPSQEKYRSIKEKVKQTWKNTGVPDKSGKKMDTESRLKAIGSKVRGWRNYHRYCDMGNHKLWSVNQWLWKKVRRDKAKTKRKEIAKQLSKKKAGSIAHIKSLEMNSEETNSGNTPKTKVKGAGKRILTNAQIKIAFSKVECKVNKHVMVKGAASPYDGNLTYWVNRKSKEYIGSSTGQAMTRQNMKCSHCNHPFMPDDIVELHHIDGDHSNMKPKNCVALHRECHQHQEIHKVRVKEGKTRKSSLTAIKPGSLVK